MSGRRVARARRRLWPVLATAVVVLVGGGWAVALSQRDSDTPGDAPPAGEPAAAPEQEPDTWRPSDRTVREAERIAATLSTDDLAGQLLVARHFDEESSLELVRERGFAGVMVTTQHILDVTTDDPLEQVKAYNEQLRAAGRERGRPVLIPIDQEGGVVARLRDPLTAFPSFMTAGAAAASGPSGQRAVREAARGSGEELRAAGYNTAFAPVADLTVGPDDPLIRTRSPGSDPQAAAAAVSAAIEGYGEAGLLSSAKHFPGHRVDEDSHRALPRLEADRAELETTDLVPFAAAIDVDAPMIMTGHLDVPALDAGTPASMSPAVVTDLLREELGYEGVIVSDSLGMGPIMERYPGGEAAVAALRAGSDLALMPADNVAAHDAVVAALESGDLPEEQARSSAARVLAWTLHAEQAESVDAEPGSRADAARALSVAGLTVVGCADVPTLEAVTPVGDPEAVARFSRAAQDAGLPLGGGSVVALTSSGRTGWGDVAVATGTPYGLADAAAPVRLALYDDGVPAMEALVAVLSGRAEPGGELSVAIEGLDEDC